jgi:uncharacterized membrane protein YraQ (UPF0718 family)
MRTLLGKHPVVPVVLALYALAFATAPTTAIAAVQMSLATLLGVAPIIVAVFSLVGLLGIVLPRQWIGRQFGSRIGVRTALLALGFGTVLVGPAYAIYPLLRTFREHGARPAVIVAVLTASGVKLPFLPLEAQSLGWPFALVRFALTIAVAVALGWLVERLLPLEAPRAAALGAEA